MRETKRHRQRETVTITGDEWGREIDHTHDEDIKG